jgi:polysaccharide pyruvyl transferase CsaB
MTSIGIVGSYGGLNAGDEAILTAMIASLRERVDRLAVTVFSRDAEHTRAHHDVETVVAARSCTRDEARRRVEDVDLVLLGGGGILYDGEARHYLRLVRLAQQAGVPTMAYAVGAGPLTFAEDQRQVRDALALMRAVTVRDDGAREVLEQLDLECAVDVTGDPALLLRPEPLDRSRLREEGVPDGRPLVGMSLREPGLAAPDLDVSGYVALLGHTADFVADRYGCDIVFIPMESGDIRLAYGVMARMLRAERAHVLRGSYRPAEILGLMAHLDLVVAMRLHVLMFAALTGTPLFPLPYAPKVTDFLRAAHIPSPPPVTGDSVGSLLAGIDRAWDVGHHHPRAPDAAMVALQVEARRTLDVALGCLG